MDIVYIVLKIFKLSKIENSIMKSVEDLFFKMLNNLNLYIV